MPSRKTNEKPWSGRFTVSTDTFVQNFSASVNFDQRLAVYDIRGSLAHARMLTEVGILKPDEFEQIETALAAIEKEINSGEFHWSIELEDVHMNIESALVDRIGTVGKKLHTARSRNDQVATDLRLYLRAEIDELIGILRSLTSGLIDLSEREAATLMPGYTHLQAAQPVSFGHHMLAWVEMLLRDMDRFRDCRVRVNSLPLGAGALAGTTFPIKRERVAEMLDFETIAENSLDAVSDRDFAIEFAAASALLMVHLSRMAEELILWSSQAFSFLEIGDAFCTGSSMMPQKKNPDIPELVRGKSGRVVGDLMALLTLMKAQPLAYNRDNQEDKEPVFDAVDTTKACVEAFCALIPALKLNHKQMRAAADIGYIVATDLADYLVTLGLPFRDAHAAVGRAVQLALQRNCELRDLSIEDFKSIEPRLDDSVYEVLDLDNALNARAHFGGTAPEQVRAACLRSRVRLQQISR